LYPTPPAARARRLAPAVLAILFADVAAAQVRTPDAGAILRETDPTRQTLPPATAPAAAPRASAERATDGATVAIRAIHVTGASRYSEAELLKSVGDLVGREVDFLELRRAADRIAQRYRADGWFARAYLPEQALDDGVLTIAVVEARIGDVRVEGPDDGSRVGEERIRRMLLARQADAALSVAALERAALVVDDLPGIAASVVLAPGAAPGRTDVVARVQNTERWLASVQADNGGIASTGRDRVTGQFLLESPLRLGDEATAAVQASRGNQYLSLGYELPVGAGGWRVGASASRLRYELGERFAALQADGRASTWGANASYPLLRGNRTNARFVASAEERRYRNFALDVATSDSRVRALHAGLSFDRLDGIGGGGLVQAGLQATRGAVDLSRNAEDYELDAATARTDGQYTKLAWNLARLQRVGDRDRLLVSLTGQRASRNLDSSEQLSLGGNTGVRAYPELEGEGDEGWIATAEWTRTLAASWRVSAFYDVGTIRQHHRPWDGWNARSPALRNRYSLDGGGAAVAWAGFRGIEVRGTAAMRAGRNPGADPVTGRDNDGSSRDPQLWLTVQWRP
jgi:hemolysin activation/secretion protein